MEKKIKILLIEDEPLDAELIIRVLQKGRIDCEVFVVNNKVKFESALLNFSFDLVLSDHSMPSFNSFEALQLLKKANITVPFILITATMPDEFAVNIMKEGAQDYVLKDRLHRLPSAVTTALLQHQLKGDQLHADFEMKELTTRLILATKSAGMGIWDWDLETQHLGWDKGMHRLYDTDDLQFDSVYDAWLTRLHPGDKDRVNGDIQMALLGKKEYNSEFRIIWNDLSVHYIKATAIMMKDDAGRPKRMIGTNWDITERKENEENLINATKSFQVALRDLEKIMNASVDIICSIDEGGKFVNVSSASEKILGYTPSELIGARYIDLVYPEDAESTVAATGKIVGGTPVTMFENRVIHKDKSIVPLLWSARWDNTDKLMYCIAKDATAKKKLERAFDNERQRFHDMFLSAPASICVLKGPDHVYQIANSRYLQLLNKTADIIGNPIKDVLPELIEQGLMDLLDHVYKSGEPFVANEMLIRVDSHDDGQLVDKYLNFVNQPYRNNEGEVEGIFFFAIDVSEQVLSRKKIAESEKRYRQIVETAQDGIWMIDKFNRTTFVNKRMCEILEYTYSEMIGKRNTFFMDKEGRETAAAASISRVLGTAEKMDISMVTKSGKRVWVTLSGSTILDENGKYNSGLAMVKDITGQKLISEKLLSSESRLKEAEAIAHLGNWEIDLATNSYFWSDEMYKIFGVQKESVIPSEEVFMSFFHREDLDYANEKIQEGFSSFKDISFDVRFVPKTGGIRYGYNEWKFKFDDRGNPSKLLGIFQDITDRKMADLERTRMVNDLVQRNKDLEQFAYIVSHNLRAPVANILGASIRLSAGGLKTETRELLTHGISESVTKLDNVVKDLNHILEIKGEVNEIKEKVSFSKLVEDIKISIQNLIVGNDIQINYEFSGIDEFVTLKSYIYSIFYNLITNSIKYRRQHIQCAIEIKSSLIKDVLHLTFTDNCMGIDIEKKGEYIFGLYKRFHPDVEGKGMGLFMVKTQVEILGGKISVESKVNEGTKFLLEFKV